MKYITEACTIALEVQAPIELCCSIRDKVYLSLQSFGTLGPVSLECDVRDRNVQVLGSQLLGFLEATEGCILLNACMQRG